MFAAVCITSAGTNTNFCAIDEQKSLIGNANMRVLFEFFLFADSYVRAWIGGEA